MDRTRALGGIDRRRFRDPDAQDGVGVIRLRSIARPMSGEAEKPVRGRVKRLRQTIGSQMAVLFWHGEGRGMSLARTWTTAIEGACIGR